MYQERLYTVIAERSNATTLLSAACKGTAHLRLVFHAAVNRTTISVECSENSCQERRWVAARAPFDYCRLSIREAVERCCTKQQRTAPDG